MDFLLYLQDIRTPFLDDLLSAATYLGDQTLLLAIGLIVVWCADKEWGYRLFFLGICGAVINLLIKAVFLVPRPWVQNPALSAVEAAVAHATGYSFPSGHTQSAVLLFGGLALWLRKRPVWVLAVIGALLVGFSRMYLGVHTPLDVGVSLLTGVALLFFAHRLFKGMETNARILPALGLIGVALAVFTALYLYIAPASQARVAEFDSGAMSDSFSALGGMLGLLFIYIIDKRYINFPVKAVWWAQIIKVAVGLGLVMLTRLLTKDAFNALFQGHAFANCPRYFMMAAVGGALWPLSFKWFARFGKKAGRV